MTSRHGIVVGHDGTPAADLAVDWAAATAARTGESLVVHHVVALEATPTFTPTTPFGWTAGRPESDVDPETLPGVARARALVPAERVTGAWSLGSPVSALLAESEKARLVVTGSRGRGVVASGLLGSTAYAVAAHAKCPVVVVRGPHDGSVPPQPGPDHRVVVGLDDVASSEHALLAAAAVAEDCGAPLLVVRSVGITPVDSMAYSYGAVGYVHAERELRSWAEAEVATAVERLRTVHPDVAVTGEVVDGQPGHVLAQRSEGAGLVVVGSRGRGGFAGLLLGSVSHDLIHDAVCPVMVVR